MKKWSHLSFSMLPELWSLNCPKKCIFCNFVLISVRNLSLLKQFTYMCLKNLNTDFQKMFWFMGVWATVHEILAIRISKKCWLSRNLPRLWVHCCQVVKGNCHWSYKTPVYTMLLSLYMSLISQYIQRKRFQTDFNSKLISGLLNPLSVSVVLI